MPGFTSRLGDGWRRGLQHLPLALVPIALALTNVDRIQSVLAVDGFHVGIRLGAPVSVVTVWQFVSTPTTGAAISTGVPIQDASPALLLAVPVLLVVEAGLAAGYFGSIAGALRGDGYDFLANARAHLLPFVLLTVVPFLLVAPVALVLVGGFGPAGLLPLVLLGIPLLLLLSYLFYATPYLIVLRNVGLIEAARASYGLAVGGGAYLRYFLGYALFVLLLSPFATLLVVDVPVIGLLLGIPVGGVLGLALNVATMRFVADVDPESSALGSPGTEEYR